MIAYSVIVIPGTVILVSIIAVLISLQAMLSNTLSVEVYTWANNNN